jgi:hypothetical protein
MNAVPPVLPRAVRIEPEKLLLLCSLAGLVVGLVWCAVVAAGLGGPVCSWKSTTGIPCAGCGATRSVLLLFGGQWVEAWRMNPGVLAALTLLLGANLYAAAVVFLRLEPWRPRGAGGWPWRWVIGGGVALNWIYLIAAGRA